jgi:argininosuccinate lyase
LSSAAGKGSTKLWGGRFAKDTDPAVLHWVDSIPIDKNLAVEDTWGSIGHVTMLGRQGIIPAEHAGKIANTLLQIQNGMIDGSFQLGEKQDDVHMDVEAHVIERLGMDIGGRMHATRSRNDQVVVDSKMYARRRLLELRNKVTASAQAFLDRSADQLNNVMVGYTHFQHAQPISVAYWLSHYSSHLLRDLIRLKHAYDITDENPLGGGAIAGTSFPIDRLLTTKLLGFQKVHEHGLDATSSRDFMLDVCNAAATLNILWSRLAEELILYSSYEFRTVSLDDGFAMGSSMMPQKKNPGTLELLRGRAGRTTGLLTAAHTMLKGLPHAYNRDFHEDKEILVAMLDLVNAATQIIPALVKTTTFNLERMAQLPFENFSTATELANYLVAKHKVPFRQAHHIVGTLVGELVRKGQNFKSFEVCRDHLKKSQISAPDAEIRAVLDPKPVMQSYNSLGGTGPKSVQNMLDRMQASLQQHKEVLKRDESRVSSAYEASRRLATDAVNWKSADDIRIALDRHVPSISN